MILITYTKKYNVKLKFHLSSLQKKLKNAMSGPTNYIWSEINVYKLSLLTLDVVLKRAFPAKCLCNSKPSSI